MELLKFLAYNWDTITLVFTNIAALFIDSPKQRKRAKEILK